MTMLKWLRRLYDAVFCADRRVLDSLGDRDADAHRYFHHVLAAGRVWLLRLRGEDSSGRVIWPEFTKAKTRSVMTEKQEGYGRLLEHPTGSDLMGGVEWHGDHHLAHIEAAQRGHA